MKNIFQSKKIWLDFQKSIFLLFWAETLFENYKKFRNIILFTDYIKCDSQTFDCYIYIFFVF